MSRYRKIIPYSWINRVFRRRPVLRLPHLSITNIVLSAILIICCLIVLFNTYHSNLHFVSNSLILTAPISHWNSTLTNHPVFATTNTNTMKITFGTGSIFRKKIYSEESARKDEIWSSGLIIPQNSSEIGCRHGIPCVYHDDDVIDFRIIVLTYERNGSLLELLTSLDDLEMDGDVGALEIWIDRDKSGAVSEAVVDCARNFNWTKGRVRVHVQEKHAGLYGQWIDTWRPRSSTRSSGTDHRDRTPRSKNNLPGVGELVLILEDDMSISRYAYPWLKAAHHFYANRSDIAGLTLQSEGIIVAKTGAYLTSLPTEGVAFLYRYMSSWGFAPRARVWSDFQDWYYNASSNPRFHPYVGGIVPTQWYKNFEERGTKDSMWTMWFAYYCHHHKLYTLYNNVRRLVSKGGTCCLGINRRERGLHYRGRGSRKQVRIRVACLTCAWKEEFVNFTRSIVKLEYNGKQRATL